MARKQLFFNVIFITATSFLLKISGMFFKVYLSNKLGAEKLGLYQLLMAFFGFLITLTTSGVQLSITRLLAYKYGNSECGKSANVIKVALKFVLKTTVIVSIFIFVNANIMSERIVKDSLMVLPIKILSLCLFPIAFSCCYKGYFASIRKNYLINISQIIEDLVKIFIVITIFEYFNWHKFDNMFLVLSLSIFISEIMSFIYLHFCFKIKTNCEKKHDNYKTVKKELLKSIFILGGGGLLISFIHMIENFSIPYCFRMYGFESSVSLSKYGILKGMAVPVLIFPSAIITAISNVMMPEISRLNSKNNREYMRKIIEKSIKLTIVFSVFMLGFFLCFSNEISILLYKNIEVGKIIKTLSYFVPFMYMESVLVSQLVALNREKYVFRVILSDSLVRLILIYLLVPRLGFNGIILVMYVSNILTPMLCLIVIFKVVKLNLYLTDMIIPIISIFLSMKIVLLYKYSFNYISNYFLILSGVILLLVLYIFILTINILCKRIYKK